MWFNINDNKLDYIERAPFNVSNEIIINASPEKVYDILMNKDWINWFQDFVSVEWTTPEPHNVNSKRIVKLKTLSVKETILAQENHKRFSFSITAITLPLVKDMLEDMKFEKTEDGNTKMSWKVYYTPSLLMSLIHPIGRAIFGSMFAKSIKNFKNFVEKQN